MAQSLLPDAFPQFQQPHLSDFLPVQLHCDGLAGTSRIFAFMDEQPETDEGYLNAGERRNEQRAAGKLKSIPECGRGKHPHHDGTLTYTKLEGALYLTMWTSAIAGQDRSA